MTSEVKTRNLELTLGANQRILNLSAEPTDKVIDGIEVLNTFRGPQGPKGADGTMRFEDLTPEQIESLRGPKGDRGDDGKDAPQDAFTPSNPPTAEQVGALPKNGTAVDSAKLGGKAPEYYLQPRNLLDNSDFRNPVNQRGFTSVGYTGEETYCIDRWLASCIDSTGSISLTENGLVCVNAYIVQRIPIKRLDENKKYTLAIKYEGSEDVMINVSPWIEFNYGNGAHHRLIIYGINGTVEHVALYEGSYTAETLPPYVPKGYAAELTECQRYFERIQLYKYSTGYIGEVYFALQFSRKHRNPSIAFTRQTKGDNVTEVLGVWSISELGAGGALFTTTDTAMAHWYGYVDIDASL